MNWNKILLDTNIVLYLLSGDSTLADFLRDKQIVIAFTTELELIGFSDTSVDEQEYISDFLRNAEVVKLNVEIKNIYARLRKEHRIKLGDATIAASALFMNIPLMTADRLFSNIRELELVLYDKAS